MKLETEVNYQFGKEFSFPIQTLEGRIIRSSEALVPINYFNGVQERTPDDLILSNQLFEAIIDTFDKDEHFINFISPKEQLEIINSFHFYKSLHLFVTNSAKLNEHLRDLYLLLLGKIFKVGKYSEKHSHPLEG